MLAHSDASRLDAIAALAQQYQCFATAAPIPTTLAPPVATTPLAGRADRAIESGIDAAAEITTCNAPFCLGGLQVLENGNEENLGKSMWFNCSHCHYKAWFRPLERRAPTKWSEEPLRRLQFRFVFAQHLKSQYNPVLNGSTICWRRERRRVEPMDLPALAQHLISHVEEGVWICKDVNGMQRRRRVCGNARCDGVHC